MAEGSDHRKHQLRPRRRYRQGRDSQLEMAGVDFVEELPRKDDLILVLNSGSSSLKFGIYHRGAKDEEPMALDGVTAHYTSVLPAEGRSCSVKVSSSRKVMPLPLSLQQSESMFPARP